MYSDKIRVNNSKYYFSMNNKKIYFLSLLILIGNIIFI